MKIKIKPSVVIVVLTVVSTLGSLYSNAHPAITTAFVLIGLFAYLYSEFLSRVKEKQDEYMQQAQAILLNKSGAGNLHFQAFLEEVKKTHKCKNDVELLQKALEIEPNNIDAYAMLCNAYALKLAFCYNVGDEQNENFKHNITTTKKMARDALKHHPNMYELHTALGILYDTEGNHIKARKEFEICGLIDGGFAWHLLMSTSWRMSGDNEKALEHAEKALEEGAPKWFADLYFGQAYCGMGDYKSAEPCLLSTIKTRGMRPEYLNEMAKICYMQLKGFKVFKYHLLHGFVLLFVYRRINGFMYLWAAFVWLYIISLSFFYKKLWPLVRNRRKLSKKLCPEQPEISVAEIYAQQGNFIAAKEVLMRVYKLKPNNPIYYSNLAACFAGEGDIENATLACNQAIKLAPDIDLLLENKKKLESGDLDLGYITIESLI